MQGVMATHTLVDTKVIFRGGGVTCHEFEYGRAAGVHGPHPIHIRGANLKNRPINTSHIENYTHSYTIFKILPIHILFG